MIIEFIAWTGAIIFALTGLLTLMSLVGIVKMEQEYKKKLFYALILEVVAVGIFVFRDYSVNYSRSDKWNFVSITTPHFDLNQSTDILDVDTQYPTLFVNGVVQYDEEKGYEPRIVLEDDGKVVFSERVATNNRGVFKMNIPIQHFHDKSDFKLKLQIVNQEEIVKEDVIKGIVNKSRKERLANRDS